MNNHFVLWAIPVSLILVGFYLRVAFKRKNPAIAGNAVSVFSYAFGVASGVHICTVVLLGRANPFLGKEHAEMFSCGVALTFTGGLALLLFALNKMVKKFQGR